MRSSSRLDEALGRINAAAVSGGMRVSVPKAANWFFITLCSVCCYIHRAQAADKGRMNERRNERTRVESRAFQVLSPVSYDDWLQRSHMYDYY